jgi:hypothetical protein
MSQIMAKLLRPWRIICPPLRTARGFVISLFVAASLVAPASAGEPHVTFALKGRWVEFTVQQAGKPVADAILQVIDEQGKPFAEGQTGPEGESAFPLPGGSSFTVEIKTGPRTADPIRLFKTGEGIEPARVLLSYGLRPCCRSNLRKEPVITDTPGEPEPPPRGSILPWLCAAALLLGVCTAATNLRGLNQRPTPPAS